MRETCLWCYKYFLIFTLFTADDNKQFTWTGTGQKLFSGGGGGDNGKCDESVEDGDESGATYDPHYEPIIDLPDLVDVKTGNYICKHCLYYIIYLNVSVIFILNKNE